jgi:hypothetical protein
MSERDLRDRNAERVVGGSRPPAPLATELDNPHQGEEEEREEIEETTYAIRQPPAPNAPASAKQLEEMTSLLEDVLANPTAKTIGAVLRKRPWLRRGKAAFETYVVADECPPEERPFFEFFDQVHGLVLEHMVKASDHKREGDGRLWLDFLGRLWPSEYSKWQSDTASNEPTVIVIERPPREIPPEYFDKRGKYKGPGADPQPEPGPDLAA